MTRFISQFKSTNEIDSTVLLGSIFGGFWGAFLVFATCECSERFDSSLSEVTDMIGQLEWYLLPIEAQKMLPILLMYTQKPLTIKFFGNIDCSREQFKKVYIRSLSILGIMFKCFYLFSGVQRRIQILYGAS